ncbi:LuxR family two component transcriptional regulator [Kordia periserrulae]|uniref:LuxR family two component transcriptional regulator n=1 Tax=Kordia periserrulae TaxID=701523 RepID=A0A2T6BTX8_9FLAO|nr:response regulator transcription factor [Kordia periserrulae]PTX59540.1 LuxR family two component transcriptional regulator [Kordia periserrulae]
MITVAIAEDHQALIDGMLSYLEYEEDISIVGCANDGEALLEIVRRKQPKVVICDIRMPKMDGIVATRHIKKEFPHINVLAFTMYDQDKAVQQMLDAGATGYILKNSPLKVVLEAIHTLSEHKTYYDAKLNIAEVSKNSSKSILSRREKEILALIAQRKTSQEIADLLFISKSTIDTHRKNMIQKLQLQGANELLGYAIEQKYAF